MKGAANLYTKEFFEVMKQHLNPGGTVTMYIQLFETNLDAVKSSVATFFEVFPNGTIWGNPYQGQGHDMVLLGQAEPLRIDLDQMEQRVGYRGDSQMAQSLAEVGMNSPVDLFATYAGRARRSQAVVKRRRDQSRPESAHAVPGRPRTEPRRQRGHLRRHAGLPAFSRGSLLQRRRAGRLAAGGYSPGTVAQKDLYG